MVLAVPAAPHGARAADNHAGEPEIPAGDPDTAAYLHAMHARVHERWADNFLRLADVKLPLSNPLNVVGGRAAEFRLVLGNNGSIQELALEKSSGFGGFDDAAREVLRDSAPFPAPPAAVLSDDDRVHLHWTLARDRRACAGLRLDRVAETDDRALPRMVRFGYIDEAVRRTRAASARLGLEAGITLLAHSWLRESIRGPYASVKTAELLLARGEIVASGWLERALLRPETAADAAVVMAADRRPVCSLVRAALEGFDERQRTAAALALQDSGDPACAPGLLALLSDRNVDVKGRAAAAAALGSMPSPGIIAALKVAAQDERPALRGTARVALANVRTHGRFAALTFHMTQGRPEERVPAAMILARSRHPNAVAQIALVTDPKAALAVTGTLARNPEPEAARVLEHLLGSPDPEVRVAAGRALLARRSRSALPPLGKHMGRNEPPELQALGLAAASPPQIAEVAGAAGWGFAAYRAWLAQGDRERAGRWLLDNLSRLPAPLQVDAMCEWLAWRRATD